LGFFSNLFIATEAQSPQRKNIVIPAEAGAITADFADLPREITVLPISQGERGKK